jgi:alpha,alpha-trehalase
LGFIPNGNRSYYLSRSQPPMYFAMVALLDPERPARAFARYLPQLMKEHGYWMRGESELLQGAAANALVTMPDGSKLNRYWDDCERPRSEAYGRDQALSASSPTRKPEELYRDIRAGCATGWDFSSRWFADTCSMAAIETTTIVPVDLNSLLYGLERAIEAGARECGQAALAGEYGARAEGRLRAMNKYLWNDETGLFDDYDWRRATRRNAITPAALFPLFVSLATRAQAKRTALTASRLLLRAGGLVTSLHDTGEQWDAPNGWAPLQWIAIDGLRTTGHAALAKEIARRWLVMVAHVFTETGRLYEKYDVTRAAPGGGGEYAVQDGFGWTNGVTAALLEAYPDLAELVDGKQGGQQSR